MAAVRHRLALALALALPCVQVCAQEGAAPDALKPPPEALEGVEAVPLALEHRYTAGKRLVYEQRQTMDIDQGPMGTVTIQTGFGMERLVKEGRPEGALLVEKFLHVVQEVTAQGQTHTLDTRDGTRSGNPGVDCMEGLVGGAIEVEVAGPGEVKRVSGAGGLVERVVAACPEHMQDMMAAQLSDSLNDETMARQIQESLLVFPGGELQPGATWRRAGKYPLPPLDEVDRTIDYVYLGVVERGGVKCAKLWTRTKVGAIEAKQTVIQGQPATVSLSAFEGQAAILVRAEDGEVLEYGPMEVKYTLDLKVAGQEMQIGYRALTRVEARPADEAAPPAQEPAAPTPQGPTPEDPAGDGEPR